MIPSDLVDGAGQYRTDCRLEDVGGVADVKVNVRLLVKDLSETLQHDRFRIGHQNAAEGGHVPQHLATQVVGDAVGQPTNVAR